MAHCSAPPSDLQQMKATNTIAQAHANHHREAPRSPFGHGPRPQNFLNRLPTMSDKMRFKTFMSELLGTFFLVYLSQTALASFELLGTQNDIISRRLATLLAYGLAFALASLMTLNLSGAHLNPAYTLASATFGDLRWGRAVSYTVAQYLGAFLAAIFLHATYSDKLGQRHTEGLLVGMNATLRAHGNILSTGKFFSSYPPTEVSLAQLHTSHLLATATLTSLTRMVYKSRPTRIPRNLKPIYLAGAHCLVLAAFCANGGPVFNPAQDFSPRLYIFLFGWGSAAFNLYNYKYWWLCGILAPHLGALIGFAIYRLLDHLGSIPNCHQSDNDDKLDGAEQGGAMANNYPHRGGPLGCEYHHHSTHDYSPASRTADDFR